MRQHVPGLRTSREILGVLILYSVLQCPIGI